MCVAPPASVAPSLRAPGAYEVPGAGQFCFWSEWYMEKEFTRRTDRSGSTVRSDISRSRSDISRSTTVDKIDHDLDQI